MYPTTCTALTRCILSSNETFVVVELGYLCATNLISFTATQLGPVGRADIHTLY